MQFMHFNLVMWVASLGSSAELGWGSWRLHHVSVRELNLRKLDIFFTTSNIMLFDHLC